jgi:hypothetical protein
VKNCKTRRRKARNDCTAIKSQGSPSRHAALKQKQVFFYSGVQNTVKGKVQPRTQGPKGEQGYSSILSSTSGIDGLDSQCHAPAALPPGKRRGTKCTEGWVGPRDHLDSCGKSRSAKLKLAGVRKWDKKQAKARRRVGSWYLYFGTRSRWKNTGPKRVPRPLKHLYSAQTL